jgi:hypothetical protein
VAQNLLPRKKKLPVWTIVLLSVIFIVGSIGGAGYYFYNKYLANNRWKPLLQERMKALILKSSDSLYHIEYSDFDLNATSGSATLHDFKLAPDTARYNQLVALKKAPDNLFILSVKKLSIKNVGARKAYQEKILDIDNITIENPDLTIINKRLKFNDTVKIGKPKSPYEVIKNIFKQLRIDSISLKDISVNYIRKTNKGTKHTAIKHVDISILGIMVDSLADNDPNRFYYTKDVKVTLHGYNAQTPDGLYNANLEQIHFSTRDRNIVLDKVTFTPRFTRFADFYKKTGKAGDIFTLKFKQIAINDIDLQLFLRDQTLNAASMDVVNANIGIYSNNAFSGVKTSKIGKDPHQALQNVALDMTLKRLNIKNATIEYSETDKTTGATGQILFTHTNGYILNATNDDDAKKANPYMKAVVNTRFMDAAPLLVKFKFNLLAADGAFNYSGELGKFDGRVLDKLVKPLAMVRIKSADIEKLDFNVDASNYGGKGNVTFYYKNLNVQLLKKVDGDTALHKQGLVSYIANKFVIEPNNPGKNGILRPGPVDLKREATMSFFTFLYKGLLDGVKPSVGFNKKKENTVQVASEKVDILINKANTLVDKFKKFKEDRKERRELRRAKRDSIKKAKQTGTN